MIKWYTTRAICEHFFPFKRDLRITRFEKHQSTFTLHFIHCRSVSGPQVAQYSLAKKGWHYREIEHFSWLVPILPSRMTLMKSSSFSSLETPGAFSQLSTHVPWCPSWGLSTNTRPPGSSSRVLSWPKVNSPRLELPKCVTSRCTLCSQLYIFLPPLRICISFLCILFSPYQGALCIIDISEVLSEWINERYEHILYTFCTTHTYRHGNIEK